LVRLILADPGLQGAAGHHLNYIMGLAEAAQLRGMPVLVLAHSDFAGGMPSDAARLMPTFNARYQTSGDGGPLRATLLGAFSRLPPGIADNATAMLRRVRRIQRGGQADSFGRELAGALRALQSTGSDVLVLPSVSAANLAGLADALAADTVGRICIVLRRLPEEMDASDSGPSPIGTILRGLGDHFGPGLHLFADTRPLADLWRGLLGIPVTAVPLPVTVSEGSEGQESPVGEPPNLVFAGGGRSEKGYCLLPAIVAAFQDRARFTIQSGPIDRRSDPAVQRAHRALKARIGPRVQVIERELVPQDYLGLLRDADLMLLPYDPDAYGPRSSGILAETRTLAIPAVVPRGCWMEQEAGPAQAFAFDFPDGFAASVADALAQLGPATEAMRAAAPAWRAIHNPETLLDVLQGLRPGL
jgi:hypothetical protein